MGSEMCIRDSFSRSLPLSHYRLFGLKVQSEFDLPQVLTDDTEGPVDLRIRVAQFDAMPGRQGFQKRSGRFPHVVARRG